MSKVHSKAFLECLHIHCQHCRGQFRWATCTIPVASCSICSCAVSEHRRSAAWSLVDLYGYLANDLENSEPAQKTLASGESSHITSTWPCCYDGPLLSCIVTSANAVEQLSKGSLQGFPACGIQAGGCA